MNEIERVVDLLGLTRTAAIAGVSLRAVDKWKKAGRLPRTEATGETNYAEKLAAADPKISKARLLATVYRRRA